MRMSIEKLCGVLKIACAKLSYFVYKALSDVCVNINIEKIYTKFWFLFGDFHQDPHRPFGDFENPLGQHAVPSGLRSGPQARRAALWDFQNPLRAPGDLDENPLTKIRILPTNS